ncbi:hypothetical protein [Cellulomonas sp. ATA003]|uniref:hypothetical protein n=1 Tax=Cellulomonas sp. ATA003 TaxID=3073064 RepID=UPI002873CDC7|nr:hypothetical protein [Cellulomonas sp. ATA003]WNB86477.1 hypothetical protein REH70_04370 [Cellulomonas sp. ATA003]
MHPFDGDPTGVADARGTGTGVVTEHVEDARLIARELLDPVLVGGRLGQKLQLGRHGPGEEVDEAFELDLVEWSVAGPLFARSRA